MGNEGNRQALLYGCGGRERRPARLVVGWERPHERLMAQARGCGPKGKSRVEGSAIGRNAWLYARKQIELK